MGLPEDCRGFGVDAAVGGLIKQGQAELREPPVVEGVEPESKLTSGFSALTATVQVRKRGPRHRQLKWIVENLIRAALVYGVNQALDYFKELLRGQLQRSLGNGGPGKETSPGCVRAITR